MKKSELRSLIREEIKNTLNDRKHKMKLSFK